MSSVASISVGALPVWTWRQLDPDAGPIAIHQDGRIVACDRELSEMGMKVGDELESARLVTPRAAFRPRDPMVEAAIWEDLLYLLHDIAPRLLPVYVGMVLLEQFNREKLRRLTRALRIRTCITARRFTSLVGSLRTEEGETMELTPAGAKRMLDESPSRLLMTFGFDAEIVERLGLIGHTTIGSLWGMSGRHLVERCGIDGERLFGLLHRNDEEPVPEFQSPPAIVASHDFDAPIIDPIAILSALDHLVHRAVGELGGLRSQLLSIRCEGWHGDHRLSRRVLKEPLARPYPLYVAAEAVLRAMQREAMPIARITIELGALSHPEGIQGMLFERSGPAAFHGNVVEFATRSSGGRIG